MGKNKKEKRVEIEDENANRKVSSRDKKINEFYLVLENKEGKKILGNFSPSRPLREGEKKDYINFNYDREKCTPAFIYENTQARPLQKSKEAYAMKLKNAREQTTVQAKAVQPKEKKGSYCCVCRKPYDNYFEHTQTKDHIKISNESEFSEGLRKIEKFYMDRKERRIKKEKKSMLNSIRRVSN